MERKDDDMKEVLREALSENWQVARHIETLRQRFLSAFILIFGGVLTAVLSIGGSLDMILMKFWPVFSFLLVFSILTLQNFVKWNNEHSNHLRAVQWISEKLRLNEKLSADRKTVIRNLKNLKGKEKMENDAMFQGYMALGLPLPIRVHKVFEWVMLIIIVFTSWVSFVGLISVSATILTSLIPEIGTVGAYSSLSQISIYILSFALALLILQYNLKLMKKVYRNAAKILDLRQPDEIEIRYRNLPPFWEEAKEKEQEYY